ncbi:MAG: sigma 54-interacting transcriptional regulator [Peptococcaceae bacterium]|jgi:transcriptional regulator with PAS, ATPase and Fis domain|nr:sigma 54-interacting transcriptional regulator [Peptococcaceae bacterium]
MGKEQRDLSKETAPEMSGRLKKLDMKQMEGIVRDNSNSITIQDTDGNILLVMMGLKVGNLVGENVKDLYLRDIYDWSPSLKCVETRSIVSGIVSTKFGPKQIVTSIPVLDTKGDVKLVVNTAIDKDLVDRYMAGWQDDQVEHEDFIKATIEFLSETNLPQRKIIAESQQMKQLFATAKIIAKTESTVILKGESGTGKEVVARYIHENSLCGGGPFIPVNCAAIPYQLLESEFFGYVRGAFTGANSQGKPGLFEIADKGTIFLDEIAELPLEMQSKLLRVLETGEIKRVGSTSITHVHVRLIAATNKNLQEMIQEKTFRSDLYYRLNVIPINLPPLRERQEDIVVFAHHFLKEINNKYGMQKSLSARTMQTLLSYPWPGNVRELRNVVERITITSLSDMLDFDSSFLEDSYSIPTSRPEEVAAPPQTEQWSGALKNVLKKVEEEYIKQVLEECNGHVGEAARKLGIHRSMLYRKTKKASTPEDVEK